MAIALDGADRTATTFMVASISSRVRYMTTPSQIQVVGTLGSWPAAASASASESFVKSTETNRTSRASGRSDAVRARLSRWVSG